MMDFKPNRASAPDHKALAAIVLIVFGGAAHAQMTPVGTWRSIDDATKEPKAQVVITEANGRDSLATACEADSLARR